MKEKKRRHPRVGSTICKEKPVPVDPKTRPWLTFIRLIEALFLFSPSILPLTPAPGPRVLVSSLPVTCLASQSPPRPFSLVDCPQLASPASPPAL